MLKTNRKKFPFYLILSLIMASMISQSVFAYNYVGIHWNINNALYNYRTTVPSSWQTAIYNAAATWNGKSKFSLYNSADASNIWGIANYGAYNGAVGVTAIYYNGFNWLTGCNTDFNSYYSLSTAPNSWEYDVQSIALHEFGHWLNLADEYNASDSANVLYGYTSPGAASVKRYLTTDDINGIVNIYGK